MARSRSSSGNSINHKTKEKKWRKVLSKIQIPHESSKRTKSYLGTYYKHLPIKPGVSIYKAIVESKYPISRLNIKIPETLAAFDDLYWISYDYIKQETHLKNIEFWSATPVLNDRKEIKAETKYRGFVDTLEYIDTVFYNHIDIDTEVDPAIVHRSWSSFPVSQNIDVMTWDKIKRDYSFGPNADGIMQRFVYSPTHKATVYRLVFYHPTNSNERSNYGFCLTNKKHYWSPK